MNNTFSYWFKIIQFIVFAALILYFGQTLFVPLSFAFLISFILYPACLWLERKRIPRGIAIALCLIVFSLLVGLLLSLLIQQFANFTKQLPALAEKISLQLDQLGIRLDRLLGMDVEERKNWVNILLTEASQRVVQQLPQTLYATSISAVLVLLVPIYAALILFIPFIAILKLIAERIENCTPWHFCWERTMKFINFIKKINHKCIQYEY